MNPDFGNPAFWHRLHFAFTMIYHYLFPQLTMGLAWFIVFWKWRFCFFFSGVWNQLAGCCGS